jgi:PII-like signaling protein
VSIQGEQILLRAYLQTADRSPHTPTYERLVRAARQAGLAGATVLRGILGLGSHGVIQRSTWSLVQHMPIVVEFVDTADNIVRFLEGPVAQIMLDGMITLERAHVVVYRHRSSANCSNRFPRCRICKGMAL